MTTTLQFYGFSMHVHQNPLPLKLTLFRITRFLADILDNFSSIRTNVRDILITNSQYGRNAIIYRIFAAMRCLLNSLLSIATLIYNMCVIARANAGKLIEKLIKWNPSRFADHMQFRK